MLRNVAFAVLGAVLATLLCLWLIPHDRGSRRADNPPAIEAPGSPLARLETASSPGEIRAALEELSKAKGSLGPISVAASRKAFAFLTDTHGNETDCFRVGHLAALAGDTELLREMVYTHFGAAEAESKGMYVEEFLQYNPDLFFSLPDTWALWHAAGGGDWCCNNPEVTIPLIAKRAGMSQDALRILKDVDSVVKEMADTDWGRDAARTIALYSDQLRRSDRHDK